MHQPMSCFFQFVLVYQHIYYLLETPNVKDVFYILNGWTVKVSSLLINGKKCHTLMNNAVLIMKSKNCWTMIIKLLSTSPQIQQTSMFGEKNFNSKFPLFLNICRNYLFCSCHGTKIACTGRLICSMLKMCFYSFRSYFSKCLLCKGNLSTGSE